MKNIYDKLLLALAALALLGGIALFVLKSGSAPDGGSVAASPSGDAYSAIPVPESASTEASWPAPEAQSSGPDWLYDVFTPPKIYIDENGEFTAEPPRPPKPEAPFGVSLAEIVRKAYRIQLEGYIEEDLSDASKSLLLLFDEERQLQIRIRPGESNEEAAFKVVDFEIVRNIDVETSTVEKSATVTLLDERSGETVELVHGERLYDSEVTVKIVSDDDASLVFELQEVGASFETPAGAFVLREINLEENTVSVEKQASDETEAELRELSPSAAEPVSPTQPTSNSTSTESQSFDFSF